MSDRLPASLVYLLIYNPTLLPPPITSRSDEDAHEEAHILFYTSRERVASRDRMLRQVGLAKALVNFSGIFTPGQGCDSVHSQGKRMVSLSPEPDFWMHVCVELAQTPKQKKDKSKTTQDNDLLPTIYQCHEDSVHDLAIRSYLLRGYEDFKLLHGSYSSLMKDKPEALETHLERFFTPWAWRWDLDAHDDFIAHLGLPLHTFNPSLNPLIEPFLDELPSNTLPLLLSLPHPIDITPSSSATSYPPALLRYLLSLVPPPVHPTSSRRQSRRQCTTSGVQAMPHHASTNTNTYNGTHGFFSAAGTGMVEVLNVRKWAWPGSLTFRKTGISPEEKRVQDASVKRPENLNESSDASSTNASDTKVKTDEYGDKSNVTQNTWTRVEGSVDQSALDDAILSPNSHQSCETTDATGGKVMGEVEQSQPVEACLDTQDSAVFAPSVDTSLPSLHTNSPQLPGVRFSILTIFLSEQSDPRVAQRRHVLHISSFQLVLALLMDAEWVADVADEFLETLARKASRLLQQLRRVIDAESTDSTIKAMNLKGSDGSQHIICSPRHIMSSNMLFSSASPLFFESRESLARNPDVIEIFSRLTSPQHWLVARQGLGLSKGGNTIPGEAYLQTSNREASLVDADNELMGAVRRWGDHSSI